MCQCIGECLKCSPKASTKLVPHKHAAFIKAWADGEVIECFQKSSQDWCVIPKPQWGADAEYRIKPTPKPDVVVNALMGFHNEWKSPRIRCSWNGTVPEGYKHNLEGEYDHLQYVFDGETGKLKSVSIINS